MTTEKTFLERFSAVQAELKAPKGRTNKFGGYKYRSCEDILKAAKPVLARHHCLLTLTDAIVCMDGRYYVEATATVSDVCGTAAIQTRAVAREAEAKKGMDDSQITGTASSYARKYALNGLFCLDDVTDADSAKAEAEAELFAVIPCQDCGTHILPHNDGKKGYTPPQIAAMTKPSFGRELCWTCAEKARDGKTGGANTCT